MYKNKNKNKNKDKNKNMYNKKNNMNNMNNKKNNKKKNTSRMKSYRAVRVNHVSCSEKSQASCLLLWSDVTLAAHTALFHRLISLVNTTFFRRNSSVPAATAANLSCLAPRLRPFGTPALGSFT